MIVAAFVGLVVLAAIYDVLTLAWHRAREAGAVGRTVLVGCTMEALAALPFVAILVSGEWWPLIAEVIGSAIGTAIGMLRARARSSNEIEACASRTNRRGVLKSLA